MTTPFTSQFNWRIGVAASALMSLAACASGGNSLDVAGQNADYEKAISAYTDPSANPGGLDPVAAAAFWGSEYDRNPGNAEAAVNYSAALRKIGSVEQSVNVMTSVLQRHKNNPDVSFEMGKTLIEAGRAFEAVRHLEQAAAKRGTDWRVISAYGVALDQIGEHELARSKYDYALTLAPGEVQVLNNKGLSFAMDGKLTKAVGILRTAATAPGADARIRQNLALTLALKGDLFEAERLARSDLPPQVADKNIDYFRSLVVQPAYWQDFAASDAVDVPEFDAGPAAISTLTVPAVIPADSQTSAPDTNGAPTPLTRADSITKASARAADSVVRDTRDADTATDNNEEEENLAPSFKGEN